MPTQQNHSSLPQAPLVSFVVAAWNLEPALLDECLESIAALSPGRAEREIIVVDDGSLKPAVDGLARWHDDIIYVRQPHQGLSVARNTGLRMATGEYVQFVDGDDKLVAAPYEHCLDIARYHRPDIVVFDTARSGKAATPYNFDGPVSGSAYMHNHNLRAAAWGYIFRRDILGGLRFTPGLLHEDEEFTPRLFLRAERVFATRAGAYFYRSREGSIVHEQDTRHTLRRLGDTERVIFHLQTLAQRLPEGDRVALERRVAQLSMDYLYNTIRLTHSERRLQRAIDRLAAKGLFPLPNRHYTAKYVWFRRAVATRLGRRLLLALLR